MHRALRRWPLLASLLCCWPIAIALGSEDVAVPPELQARLLAKAVHYERTLVARNVESVHVLIVTKAGSALSAQVAGHVQSALGEQKQMGGRPHHETRAEFKDIKSLLEQIQNQHVDILYLMPGFTAPEVEALTRSLRGVSILSVAAASGDVRRGLVLGFDLISGRPRLMVHLGQANQQKVDFSSDFLGLTQVVQ